MPAKTSVIRRRDCRPILQCGEKSPIQMDWTFVAKNSGSRRVLEKLADRLKLTIDQCPLTDQANAVAVIGIVCTMDGAQRLNGLAGSAVPTVNGDASEVHRQPIAHYHIFLVAG